MDYEKEISKSRLYHLIKNKGWKLIPPRKHGDEKMYETIKEISKLIVGIAIIVLAIVFPQHSGYLYPLVALVVGYYFGTRKELYALAKKLIGKKSE